MDMRGGWREQVDTRTDEHLDSEEDEFDSYLEERLTDPEFRASYEDAKVRSDLLRRFVSRRKVRSISQAAVAAQMGTTQSAVSDLEAGRTDPRFSTLQRYARAIGCRLEVRFTDGWYQHHGTNGGGLTIRPIQFGEVGRAAEESSSAYKSYNIQRLTASGLGRHRRIEFAGSGSDDRK